jgi:hypothetical protein
VLAFPNPAPGKSTSFQSLTLSKSDEIVGVSRGRQPITRPDYQSSTVLEYIYPPKNVILNLLFVVLARVSWF